MRKIRIFLADDHAVVRAGLKALISAESDMEIVGEAEDGRQALALIPSCAPDIAILDVSMPELNGVGAALSLRQDQPAVKIITLTLHEDVGYVRELFDAGVMGYVLKRTGAQEIVRAIRIVHAGDSFIDSRLARNLVSPFSPARRKGQSSSDLTGREIAAMRLIAQGHVTKEVASALGVSTKTVETLKARAMGKLGLKTRVDIVRAAAERGWLQNL